MRTLEETYSTARPLRRHPLVSPALCLSVVALVGVLLVSCGKKDVATKATESDANGYVCLKCGAKYYTDSNVFIGPHCPKCNDLSLEEVVGYWCEKDHHLTIRARRGDPNGAVCEQCKAPLENSMLLPHATDLKAWGATKVSS